MAATRALVTGNAAHSLTERGDDFYPTHYGAVATLLRAEDQRLPKSLWEPACGNGAIAIPLRNRGFAVSCSDLRGRGCPDSEGDIDFLSLASAPAGVDGIVTNPPFKDAQAFIDRATAMCPYAAFLLRLAFLESQGRMGWFQRVGMARLHIISDRLPMMHRDGWDGPKVSSTMAFAWFIFDKRIANCQDASVPMYWWSWKDAAKKFPQTAADDPPMARAQLGMFAEAAE